MDRVYNFSPGPAMLPLEVMQQAQSELLNWQQSGMSVMEVSHRGKEFSSIVDQTQQDMRELLAIPDNYHILFMHGGASSQFSMVPMNLQVADAVPAYLQTGHWGATAVQDAKYFCVPHIVASTDSSGYCSLPETSQWDLPAKMAYFYYVDNESVNGVEFAAPPDVGDAPLVADMTSNILSRPIDVSRFGLIFASAQKNIGIAGITVVIIRDDLLQRTPMPTTPPLYRYASVAEKNSVGNTPATFSWYMVGLTLQWIKREGGLAEMARRAEVKSRQLYDCIDSSDFYVNRVDPAARSRMNVVFQLHDDTLDAEFLQQAQQCGLANLKGHRSVGGMRASLYNGMSESGVAALVDFMQQFEQQHG